MSDRDEEARRGYPGGSSAPGHNGRLHGAPGTDLGDDVAHDPLTFPPDLAAMQADDALLDAVGTDSGFSSSDEPLASLLLQWRREVDAEPVGELVDTDTAMALVAGGRQRPPRRNPVLLPFAAAAALAVIAFSGVGLAAKSAEPQDRLWSVTQVLYPQHARSVEAVSQVESELQRAETLLDQGREADAQVALDRARQNLTAVAEEDGRDQLAERHEVLWSELDGQPEKQDRPAKHGQAAAPPAATSSKPPPAPAQQPQPASEPTEQRERVQSTAPSAEQTTTSESEPSSETSTSMAGRPSTSPQSRSATPSARSVPADEAGADEADAGEAMATGSSVPGTGSASAEESGGDLPAEPTT